jgi:hypothetical protein
MIRNPRPFPHFRAAPYDPTMLSRHTPLRRPRVETALVGMLILLATFALVFGLLTWCLGCASTPRFPAPLPDSPGAPDRTRAFDLNHDRVADYWQTLDGAGRVRTIRFADNQGAAGHAVDLDAVEPAAVPHFVILLDGVPYEVVADLYARGALRLFHPPSRVICCYPGMTDLALSDLMHVGPCPAYQARRYDRDQHKVVAGNDAYLNATNSPWVSSMAYRCSFWWDALVYLNPQMVFDHELRRIEQTFADINTGTAYAYSVGTAGLGTRGGRAAIEEYLRAIDALCERIMFERRGRVNFTLAADHGHNLVVNKLISFDAALAAGGYQRQKSISSAKDVVIIDYGLVTYAEVYTREPAGVAACLLNHPDVKLAMYPAGDEIVVQSPAGRARIARTPHGFAYTCLDADPLELRPILDQLADANQVHADGGIDPDALFAATIDHTYPDPLRRTWRAFHGLVVHPPDLVIDLRDGACYGSRFFHTMVGEMTSTHGGLNAANATTFVLTTLGPLPADLRSADVLPALETLGVETGIAAGAEPAVPLEP